MRNGRHNVFEVEMLRTFVQIIEKCPVRNGQHNVFEIEMLRTFVQIIEKVSREERASQRI